MNGVVRILMMGVLVMCGVTVFAQNKIDDERMLRDIEIAENVLQTILRQEFAKRNFFPYEVRGTYMPGYGVTFRLPSDFNVSYIVNEPNIIMNSGNGSYSYSINGNAVVVGSEDQPRAKAPRATNKQASSDSLRLIYNQKVIEASKTFIADYGDLISQLGPDERIVITNRGDGNQRYWTYGNTKFKRTMLSIESTKGDVTQYKQGKLTRDQLNGKMKVVNSETMDELNPDLELLSSIFNRLYRPDLSKTYYSEGNIYYERLKDYGVIYYMNVVSSSRDDYNRHSIPTLNLSNVDQETRDKKVRELYPAFEKELKENILEYGRTLKSLKEEENLIFNVGVTKCEKCAIPSSLELLVKSSVLNEYNSGKVTKDAALAKINVKKGPNQ